MTLLRRPRHLAWLLALVTTTPAQGQVFTDVSRVRGTDVATDTGSGSVFGGVSMVDLDSDGLLDLLVTAERATVVFQQLSTGAFERRTDVLATSPPGAFWAHLPVDVDADGDWDVLLLSAGPSALLRNDGGMVFTDVSHSHLPGLHQWSIAAAPGDFDGDGDVDIFVGGYVENADFPFHTGAPNRLLLNDGHGHFTDVAAETGVRGTTGCSLGSLSVDYDADGDLDILVANDFGSFATPNELFRNDGASASGAVHFTEVAAATGFDVRLYGMGLAVGDVDLDGHLDVAVTSIGRPALLRSDGAGQFTERAGETGFDVRFGADGYQVGWGIAIDDFDGDAVPDIVYAGGWIPASDFLRNDRSQRNGIFRGSVGGFEPDPMGWGLAATGVGRGLAVGDFNRDGRPDIAIAHDDGSVALHQNQAGGSLPLRVRLVATETAASAEGALVTARCGGMSRVAALTGGGSYGGASDAELRFTFPGACAASGMPVQVQVRWPSGYAQNLNASTGGTLRATEPNWLYADERHVELHPTAADGAPLSPSTPVSVRLNGEDHIDATPLPTGGFAASFPPRTVATRVDLWVAGVALGAHPVVGRPSADIFVMPQRPIELEPVSLVARARDSSDIPLGSSVVVTSGGLSIPLTRGVDGDYHATTQFSGVGPRRLRVEVNGASVAERTVDVAASVDPVRSRVEFTGLYAEPDDPLQLTVLFRDANGLERNVSTTRVALLVDGVALSPTQAVSSGLLFFGTYDVTSVSGGAVLQLVVDGEPFGAPHTLRRIDSPEDALAFVSPVASRCSPAMDTIRADDHDVLDFFVLLLDAQGQPIPVDGTALTLTGDLEALPGAAEPAGASFLVRVRSRADHQASHANMQVSSHGRVLGVPCRVRMEESIVPAASPTTSTLTPDPDVLYVTQPSVVSTVTWLPRSAAGRLLGSGAQSIWSGSVGEWLTPGAYVGIGVYERELGPGTEAGVGFVGATVGEAEVTHAVTVERTLTPPDASVPRDGGATVDAAVRDGGTAPDARPFEVDGDTNRRDLSHPPDSPQLDAGTAADGAPTPNPVDRATLGGGACAAAAPGLPTHPVALWVVAGCLALARRRRTSSPD